MHEKQFKGEKNRGRSVRRGVERCLKTVVGACVRASVIANASTVSGFYLSLAKAADMIIVSCIGYERCCK